MTSIVQIVPRFAPTICGVGDYARLLSAEMERSHGLRSKFIVGDPSWEGDSRALGVPVVKISKQTAKALHVELNNDSTPHRALLHFVGYGYQKRGCPLWLVAALRNWRRESSNRRLIVMFHELFAFGPPWRSSFWLSPLQRRIVCQLVRLADQCWTNRRAYALQLWRSGRRPVEAWPVFSTIGEPITVSPLANRQPEMVIFGGGKSLEDLVSPRRHEVERICAILGLKRIISIGQRQSESRVGSVEFVEAGILPEGEVTNLLLNAKVGYLNYFAGSLGKSSVFAAFCAHGLLSLFPFDNPSHEDGLRRYKHYVTFDDIGNSSATLDLQSISDDARNWYAGHNLTATSRFVAQLVKGS